MTEAKFVEHTIVHPKALTVQQTGELVEKARAAIQRKARAAGASLADPDASPTVVSITQLGVMDTEGGQVEVTATTYRMDVTVPSPLGEATVDAVEQETGRWTAAVPAAPIVTVRHGLDSYDVDVRALTADLQPTGFHAFMPIARDAVEVVPLPGVAWVVIELVPQDDAG